MRVSTEVAEVPAHSSCQRTQVFHTRKLTRQEEQKNLNTVVERCLAKMEVDSRERPFLDACLEGVKPVCVCVCGFALEAAWKVVSGNVSVHILLVML